MHLCQTGSCQELEGGATQGKIQTQEKKRKKAGARRNGKEDTEVLMKTELHSVGGEQNNKTLLLLRKKYRNMFQ